MKYKVTKELIWLVEANDEDDAKRKANIYGDFSLGTVTVENMSIEEKSKKSTRRNKDKEK